MLYKDTPVGFRRLNKAPLDHGENVLVGTDALFNYIETEASYLEQRLNVRFSSGRTFRVRLVARDTYKNTGLFPIVEIPNFELPIEEHDGHLYGLIYYNNGSENCYLDKDDIEQTLDPRAWDLLPLMDVFTDRAEQINYILRINGEAHFFVMPNFLTNPVSEPEEGTEGIFGIEDDKYFYTTSFGCGLMPKVVTNDEVELWVQCDKYVDCMGV